jgi:tetratricopeptide (TPR) repeat protein
VPGYRQELAQSRNNLAGLLHDRGQPADAQAAVQKALALQEQLAADFPAVPLYRTELAGSRVNIGNLLRAGGQAEKALDWYAKGIATLEGVLRESKGDAVARLFLRNAHAGRAQALMDLRRCGAAAADWEAAVDLSPPPERPRWRMARAVSRVRAGQVDAAMDEAQELAKDGDARTLYNAACVFALAAGRPDDAAASLSKEQCARRAVALLEQAVAKGWHNAEHMKNDEDLNALRQREDFKKLLAALDKKTR